jgi:riboflavin biosynthesis pyrimidine reductase
MRAMPYEYLNFPSPPADRPYTFINMVGTIDGKILSGERDESVHDLGSKLDHQLMKRIESQADAVLVGAQTLRATPQAWNPQSPRRIVVTRSGNLPWESRFLSEGEAYVAAPTSASLGFGGRVLLAGNEDVDFVSLFRQLRSHLGIHNLLVMGGSVVNAQILKAELVDELFLTIAPKVKLGERTPTYADGEPLPREQLQRYEIVEHHVIDHEVFLRYRRLRVSI